jgi:hypothetical protein
VAGENMTMNATPLGVALVSVVGATENSVSKFSQMEASATIAIHRL